MPLFGSSKKSPQEIVKSLTENLQWLKTEGKNESKKRSQVLESVSKSLMAINVILCGTPDQEPNTEMVAQLAQEFYSNDTLKLLVSNLSHIDFEDKKNIVVIFNHLLRRQIGVRSPTVEYVEGNEEILRQLVKGYGNPEIALNSGMILRECIRYESLAKIVLNEPSFYNFFQYMELSTFDVASDAFSTFKELLTRHATIAAEFLEKNYDDLFSKYRVLLDSENYAVRREALKLLAEVLLNRHNFHTMTRYIGNEDNLKLMMNLLRDKSRNIQFEAFHIFKIFVANPNRTKPVVEILLKNKDKLVEFMTNFQTDRTEDEQFNDEKTYLIQQIKELKPIEENVS